MEFSEKIAGNQAFITLGGDMYIEEAAVFRKRMMEHLQAGCNHFEIDAANLRYIDSAGLGALVALQKRAQERDGGVTIRGLSGKVKELFDLTRLDKVFNILP